MDITNTSEQDYEVVNIHDRYKDILTLGIIGETSYADNFKNSEIIIKTGMEDIIKCDIILICFDSTYMYENSEFNITDITSVVNLIRKMSPEDVHPPIVMTNQVPPGTCDKVGISYFPEFIGEKHYYIGTLDPVVKRILSQVIYSKHNGQIVNITILPPKEVEMIIFGHHFVENINMVMWNDIYKYCEKTDVNYSIVEHNLKCSWNFYNYPHQLIMRGFRCKSNLKFLLTYIKEYIDLGMDNSLIKYIYCIIESHIIWDKDMIIASFFGTRCDDDIV
jgi:hypothetical protein